MSLPPPRTHYQLPGRARPACKSKMADIRISADPAQVTCWTCVARIRHWGLLKP